MTDLNATADRIVRHEVHLCLSSMVATLANAYGCIEARGDYTRDVSTLAEQASELCSPGLDYEEAARQAGWLSDEGSKSIGEWHVFRRAEKDPEGERDSRAVFEACEWRVYVETWGEACAESDVEPYEWDVFEHWAVSTWLAEKLAAAGERVDTDFAGLNVWARTTTGQAISMDAVIQRIAADVEAAR